MRKFYGSISSASLTVMLFLVIASAMAGTGLAAAADTPVTAAQSAVYAGSKSCRECHERFYQLWSSSFHGLAMQPYSPEFARKNLTPQRSDITIDRMRYRADTSGVTGYVVEKGPKGEKKYTIEHALGGKNVYYFLTPLEKGRLQTLPIAYDVKKNEWFDTAGSGLRHVTDQPVAWTDQAYTFNTACYSCHVSQLSTNFDLKTDTYRTAWAEAGINCETCHGPSSEHNRVCLEAPKGTVPKDLKIISVKKFTPEQHNSACSGCHAKMSPLTATYPPGERFFDHFDLTTLEDPDFYPDGRDLGENYTYTSWLMSPCAKAGKINCVTCHTSSGRYRFKAEEKANEACMPCHAERVNNAPAHTHHKEGTAGNKCISCHMPKTGFARMERSDHSMLPPTPAATLKFKSPNACNNCHADKDAAWADKLVREWRKRDYQAPVLKRAALIDAARKRDWKQLPAMLSYITSKDRDVVTATSLVRMVALSGDPRVTSTLLKAVKDPSPLLRGAAADALQHLSTQEAVQALVTATGDGYRLVRVRAAASLAQYPNLPLKDADRKKVDKADKEYLASLTTRPDQWSSHYNLGNYYLGRGNPKDAVVSYDTALKLEPRSVLVMVNESMAYARMGENKKAEESLQKALKVAPDSAAASFNMGLLKAEQNDPKSAEQYLRAALKADPKMAQAAYNLCIIKAKDSIDEALTYCQKAAELRPQDPRYVYTFAFYQQQKGDEKGAVKTLEGLIAKQPAYPDAYLLLGSIYEKQGKKAEAVKVYGKALASQGIPDAVKLQLKAKMDSLKGAGGEVPKK